MARTKRTASPGRVKTKTDSRATARKTPPRRRRTAATRVSLHEASLAKQKRFFQSLRRLLRDQGLEDDVVGVNLVPPITEAVAKCPPGQVTRMVCVKQPNGTVVCRPVCQPI